MGVFNDIQNALNQKLQSLSGSLPLILWPNSQKEPLKGVDYLRPTLLPASSENYTLNNGNYHQGIYQIDIFVDLNKGTSTALSIADQIRTLFLRQSIVKNTTIVHIQNISMSQAQRDEGWWHVFVEVNYLSVA